MGINLKIKSNPVEENTLAGPIKPIRKGTNCLKKHTIAEIRKPAKAYS